MHFLFAATHKGASPKSTAGHAPVTQLMQWSKRGATSAARLCAGIAITTLLIACGGGSAETDPITPPGSTTPTNPPGTTPTTPPTTTPTTPGTTPTTPGTVTPTAAFLDPAIISRANEGGNDKPFVEIDNSGNAIAVWRRALGLQSPPDEEILSRRYVAGSGWQDIQVMASTRVDNSGSINQPTLKVDPASGKAVVAWVERRPNTSTDYLIARSFDPASGWGARVVVDANYLALDTVVSLAMDGAGNAMAAWVRYESLSNRPYASVRSSAGAWSSPARIDNDTAVANLGTSRPLLTYVSEGKVLAAWNSSRTSNIASVWSNTYTPGSGWGTNAVIMAGTLSSGGMGQTRFVGLKALTSDGNGNAIMAFENQVLLPSPSNYELNLWSKRYSGGAWQADSAAVPVGLPYSCLNCPSVSGARLKMNSAGQAVVTWFARSNSVANSAPLWAARTNASGAWETQLINTGDPDFFDFSNLPDVGIDNQGNIALVWSPSSSTNNSNIFLTRFAGGAWSPTEAIESYSGSADFQRIAMNDSGNFMTVWLQFDDTLGTVIASRYYRSGR